MALSEMSYYLLFLIWFITALLVHYFIKHAFFKPPTKLHTPPSPPALPLIGHLHLIGSVLPSSFQALARRYGPLMQIRLGASTCVVASSAAVAKEIFKTQDLNFSSRPEFGSSEYFIYRGSRFVTAQYGDYWRFMKKLCMTRLLAVPQLDKFSDIRDQEKIKLVESVMRCATEGKICDLTSEFTTLTNNTICRMAMSTRCSGSDNDAEEIKGLVKTCLELAGKLSLGDVLGPFKIFDFSGTGKKLVGALKKYDRLVERIIKEHEEKVLKGLVGDRKDLMDILLEIYNDPTAEIRLSKNDIKSFLLDIFFAGTDTSSAAMQWAMGELINSPRAFKILRDEINTVVGSNRLVKESDVPNLPYLRAVVRETLRLHPSAPLIIRECGEDCKVNGSIIKNKTRVLVNVFAVMRDEDSWTNPDEFLPERFMESSEEKIGEHQMEFKGQNFRYLPFGSGRRGCPGASLAMLVMHAAVGALVQCFDWKVKDGDRVDLSLGSGFAAEMATPLVCYPIKHMNPF
ncbi:cytochrome P450, putative [Ricinus communis]|uniref:Cytochrome P450, putative n=1 Tax=Ricinus communis TaxID=3988 RepID=B9T2D3_RICCO|nr:cytochrome P450, putative [Ricinus communis]|eukprot:XP_002532402.1 3,9-dihydroxypterocarpan 6A-monooxygenase [Ricinus communis]